MRITKKQLTKIIQEVIQESVPDSIVKRLTPTSMKQRKRITGESDMMLEAGMLDIGSFQEEIEWGDWPGRDASAVSGGWNYVEGEGPKTVRFDWRGGSMWYTEEPPMGTIEGNVPPSLKKHLEQKGIKVYTE